MIKSVSSPSVLSVNYSVGWSHAVCSKTVDGASRSVHRPFSDNIHHDTKSYSYRQAQDMFERETMARVK